MILHTSCADENQGKNQKHKISKATSPKNTPNLNNSYALKGQKELDQFNKKYGEKWKEKPYTFPYSDGTTFKVYELN